MAVDNARALPACDRRINRIFSRKFACGTDRDVTFCRDSNNVDLRDLRKISEIGLRHLRYPQTGSVPSYHDASSASREKAKPLAERQLSNLIQFCKAFPHFFDARIVLNVLKRHFFDSSSNSHFSSAISEDFKRLGNRSEEKINGKSKSSACEKPSESKSAV